jgi:hypothetical protein
MHAWPPQTVSPGATDHIAEVESRCPSFSWGEVSNANSYQLVAYRIPPNEDPRSSNLETAERVLDQRLPGSTRTWTPNLEQCLTSGENYIWFLRGLFDARNGEPVDAGEWSQGLLFATSSMPSIDAVTVALRSFTGHAQESPGMIPTARLEAANELSSPVANSVPSGGHTFRGQGQNSIASASVSLEGHVQDPTGETYGVVGISNSSDGAGIAAANMSAGADMVLDGSADLLPDLRMSESGIDQPFGSAQIYNIQNSAGGGMTLQVDAVDVVTTATDQDTFGALACLEDESPRRSGSAWTCAEGGLITSISAGSGLTGGGSTGALPLSIATGGVTATHLAADSVGASELDTNSVYGSDIVNGTITYSDTNTSSVQRRITGTCGSGNAMASITATGGRGCTPDEYLTVSVGDELIASSYNGNDTSDTWNYTGSGEYFCFLSFVQLRDVDGGSEDAYCRIAPLTAGSSYWRLRAHSEFGDDSDAICRARCYAFP